MIQISSLTVQELVEDAVHVFILETHVYLKILLFVVLDFSVILLQICAREHLHLVDALQMLIVHHLVVVLVEHAHHVEVHRLPVLPAALLLELLVHQVVAVLV